MPPPPPNARRTRRDPVEDEDEGWLVTYADAITLLMAFFVMLVSFSRVELPLFEEVQAGIKESLVGAQDPERPMMDLQFQLSDALADIAELPAEASAVGFDDRGVVIDFASGAFFRRGSVELSAVGRIVLDRVRAALREEPYDRYFVEIEGHTDDVPPGGDVFPSNWELSAAQAASVTRFLIARGMAATRLKAAGYADTRPKLPNRNLAGEPIPANQAANRRIVIRLLPNFDAADRS